MSLSDELKSKACMPERFNEQIGSKLTPSQLRRLREAASRLNLTPSSLVRAFIVDGLERLDGNPDT